ncbi:hydroxyacid-oxoacid transhydrogenase [Deinococcus radiopugnans]|uniref:hydroxyacid-oxoacid transhydrogenase n=2 Tax=Deinococcus radiopugnans TaxID=57497 RepID=A0A5C4Y5Z8_9DEIO|nr:hydroxyacid-oxoacid transhydrogenase [Deinococcus radiopugnans]MBB6016317.1 alcohol dehydrogenase class IV [Deinococcus radiopugnans ATCC 19172]TNM71285.1 iron-containing alcohol dehydrogenase [Deinococcus radiopugnans ATCC 19172]
MNDERETIFTVEATPVKFGPGAALETGWELGRLGARRVFFVIDPEVRRLGLAEPVLDSVRAEGIDVTVYSDVETEPTLACFERAVAAARAAGADAFAALGGGSAIDIAKVANLVVSDGGAIMEYVNAPVGRGRQPGEALRPLLALPTTPGSGSEATTVAILDLPELRIKTGISHRRLRPAQAIVDPQLTRSAPPAVIASAGLDVVCHAAESYLSRPYTSRPRPATPGERPPYQGSNPVADLWSAQAIRNGGQFLRRAVRDAADEEARGAMMLSATMAGVGFGSAGVHIPHACAYPIAGLKHDYRHPGYPGTRNFVPHGFSVIVTAPAAFRFTFDSAPARHLAAATMLTGQSYAEDDRDALPEALLSLMRDVNAPLGVREFGYDDSDIPALVDGAMKQQRLLNVAPRTPTADDLARIFAESMG